MANRVLSFALDVASGTVSDRKVLAEIPTPDNMRMVAGGSLWVASPLSNQVIEVDPQTGETRVAFDAQTEEGAAAIAEWNRRGAAGEGRLDMLGGDVMGEMPGTLTGMIVDGGGRPIFISGLGDALVRLNR